jgi:hypothetical protein
VRGRYVRNWAKGKSRAHGPRLIVGVANNERQAQTAPIDARHLPIRLPCSAFTDASAARAQ